MATFLLSTSLSLLHLSDTFPLPFSPVQYLCFPLCHLTSLSSPPFSLSGKTRAWWKPPNEMPSQLQHKIQPVWREILQTKCNTAKREKSIKLSETRLKLLPCLPLYNPAWHHRPLSCVCGPPYIYVNLTNRERSVDCVQVCECMHVRMCVRIVLCNADGLMWQGELAGGRRRWRLDLGHRHSLSKNTKPLIWPSQVHSRQVICPLGKNFFSVDLIWGLRILSHCVLHCSLYF